MKRALVIVATLLFAVTFVAAGETADAETDKQTCKSRSAKEVLAAWKLTLPAETAGATPPCPPTSESCSTSTRRCGGTNACGVNAAGASTSDTGINACKSPDGTKLDCAPGETIHITTVPCAQCPCCSGPPPVCVCPQNCGEVVLLSCQ